MKNNYVPLKHDVCKTEDHITYVDKNKSIKDIYCLDHRVVACHCGFEWGYHKYE